MLPKCLHCGFQWPHSLVPAWALEALTQMERRCQIFWGQKLVSGRRPIYSPHCIFFHLSPLVPNLPFLPLSYLRAGILTLPSHPLMKFCSLYPFCILCSPQAITEGTNDTELLWDFNKSHVISFQSTVLLQIIDIPLLAISYNEVSVTK